MSKQSKDYFVYMKSKTKTVTITTENRIIITGNSLIKKTYKNTPYINVHSSLFTLYYNNNSNNNNSIMFPLVMTSLDTRYNIDHRPLLGHQSDTSSSIQHLRHAHAARTATSTHHTGRPLQPNTQVQPTQALIVYCYIYCCAL
jgi:uncharacterized alpha/beta hydrolase family protein